MARRPTAGFLVSKALIYSLLLVVVVVTLFPFLNIVAVSLSSTSAVMANKVTVYPVDFDTVGYRAVLQNPNFFRGTVNTIIYTTVGTAVALVLTTLAAFALSKRRIRGRRLMTSLFVFTMVFTGGVIPNYLAIQNLRLMNTIWAIVLPMAVNPWNMIIMKVFFDNIPDELEEAGEIDGYSPLSILLKIVLPLSTSVLFTMLLFYAVWFWNDWYRPMIFLSEVRKHPVTLFLRNVVIGAGMITDEGTDMSINPEVFTAAATVLVAFPIVVLYPFIQKHFVKGIMLGAIKG